MLLLNSLPCTNGSYRFYIKEILNWKSLKIHSRYEFPLRNLNINVTQTYPYESHPFLTPGGSRKGPIKQSLSVFPSILLSVRAFLWNFIISFFQILTWWQKPMWICAWQSQILQENLSWSQNWQNGPKMDEKQFAVFLFIEKFGH